MAKKEKIDLPVAAAIYARYSSANQNDASIEQQIEECTQYATQNGLTIVGTYEDRAMTGRNDRRPGFQRMIRAAERGEFGTLLTYKSNRIARNVLDALRYEDRLEKAGVKVVYCKEDFGNNAAGRLALRMMMSINEFYSENLSEDVRRGMMDSARKCLVVGSIPIGYKRGEDGHFAIDEETAPLVKEVFRRVAKRESYMSIVRDFNARGLKTAYGKPWSKNSFQVMLRNERYTGVYLFRDIRVEGAMPKLIDRDLFDAVQQVISDRNVFSGRQRNNHEYLLTGKLFCGKCLNPMVGVSAKGKNGEPHYYYSCNGRRVNKICDKKNVRKDFIEEEVARAVLTVVLDNEMVEWIADTIMNMAERMRYASRIDLYETQLKETQKQIDNIVRAVELGVVADEFKVRMAELQSEKRVLQGKIAAEEKNLFKPDRNQVVYFMRKYRDRDVGDKEFQRQIFRDYVQAVYLYDDHFKLVVDFTGEYRNYDIKIEPDFNESTDYSDDKAMDLHRRYFSAPYFPYTNPCPMNSIESVGRGFVIIWHFNM